MSWYAIDAIDDALDASREFLFPFSLGRWARLALITFFVGGSGVGGQVSNLQNVGQVPTGPTGPTQPSPSIPTDPSTVTPELGGLALVVVVVVLLLVLALALISYTFEFVFVDAIAEDRVRVLGPFASRVGDGLRLFVFEFVVGLVSLLPFAVAGFLILFAGGPPGFNGFDALVGFFGSVGTAGTVAVVVLAAAWLVVTGLVTGFTRTFVVPVMVATGSGVLGGWRRLWPRLRDEWKQTLVYLVMHFFVGIGVGLVGLLLFLFGAVVVGIVALVVGLAAAAVTHGGNPMAGTGVGLLAGGVVFALLYFLFVFLPVGILTTTYVRTYELASLAGFDDAFDLLGPYRPDRRGPGGSGDGGVGATRDDGVDGPGGGTGGRVGDRSGEDDGFGGVTPADDGDDGGDDRRGGAGGGRTGTPAG
ncbi:DUF7544 domain-containing protein [Candidatus Halobonum tyrrellensis]|uniref:Uncharacterized protein n=1 Tax=Candidatus Halobonum tyrrellensis G22 TaxID=1324957 RepID=V4HAP9_9EURY|nr:hypothetical protein [Candidatus Halobonum tyrrellensis]ESP87785.1 hypothetical protein K933_12351 [Candidatus Halobonum tyrrellensis G22]